MPVLLTRKEVLEMIESIEASGGDASHLREMLETLEPEVKRVASTRRSSRFRAEEETMEERLTREVGDLFPDGIPYQEIMDYDYRFTQKELQAMCKKAGLTVSGQKKQLAARLVANKTIMPETTTLGNSGIHIDREVKGQMAEDHESYPILPKDVSFPVLYNEVAAVIDNIGRISYTYFPTVRGGHIELVYVKPSYQRRGFGRKLLQFALDDMRKKNITKVSTSIWSREGYRLFKTFGFSYITPTSTKMIKNIA